MRAMNGRQRSRVLGAVALAITAALAAAAYATAASTHSTNFPSQGLVVPGQSIGGIQIGMTPQQVMQRWGHTYDICDDCGKRLVWLFEYRGSEPLGAAIKFDVLAPKADQKAPGT